MVEQIHKKIAHDKLIVLYIIKKAVNISLNQLNNFILEYNIINYFDFIKYQKELVDANMVVISDRNFITLTDLSIEILKVMSDNINPEIKSFIDNTFKNTSISDNIDHSIYTPLKTNGYLVKLTVKDLDENFSLEFTVDNKKEAEEIKTLWDNKSRSLYNEIINKLKKQATN